jgi:uncharacterized delta-60 repeat protein
MKMKKKKLYIAVFILILYFSFTSQGTNIINNERAVTDNKSVVFPLTASDTFAYRWHRIWDGGGGDYGMGVAADSSGNVYLVGYTLYPYDMVLVKYDENGVQQWNRTWGGNNDDRGYGVVVDSSGNVYCTGRTDSYGAGDDDILLVKYDENGLLLWNRTWGGSGGDRGYGIATDSLGNIYLAGETGGGNMVLVKYNENGVQQWNTTWGVHPTWDVGRAVVVDSLNYVYLAGFNQSGIPELSDMVLVKYDENGVKQWNRYWDGGNFERGRGVAVDSLDNVYLTGTTGIFAAGSYDTVLVKYNGNGIEQWNRTWGGVNREESYGVAVDSTNNIYLAGYSETLDEENSNIIMLKYDNNGTLQQNFVRNENKYDEGYGVAVDSLNNVYLAGLTETYMVGSNDMILIKYGPDLYKPVITINNPHQNEAFGVTAPDFYISIIEPNLNYTWYTIDDGMTNITFYGRKGIINQTEWDKKGNGAVNIIFYANDSLGNVGFNNVTIWKDLIEPDITINSPSQNQLCGIAAPTFSLTINEPNLDKKWYSLNGGENITFTTEDQINQAEWDKIGNGTVLIRFYANDTGGNMNSRTVFVRKDAYIPDLTIHSPLNNETFGKTSPEFSITVIEEDLLNMWYTIEGISGDFYFSEFSGTIDQDAWNDLPEGEITISFYAQDRAGNVNSKSVVVIKSIKSERVPFELIIIPSVIGAGAVIGVVSLLLIRRKMR